MCYRAFGLQGKKTTRAGIHQCAQQLSLPKYKEMVTLQITERLGAAVRGRKALLNVEPFLYIHKETHNFRKAVQEIVTSGYTWE